MENILEETRFILKKYNIKANKSLGQNFLINKEVVEKIVDSANIGKDDLVIEIGPGLGTLTEFLLEKAKQVICVELDERMVNILKDRFMLYDNLKIINEDILKLDLNKIISEEKLNKKINNVKIVANLPYYITTPIVMKLLEDKLDIESITIMIQKEVADRLIENPGGKNTGAITYAINYFSIPEGIMEVPNTSFIPEPEVTSKVLKLTIRDNAPVEVKDVNLLFKVIKCAFMQRRKTLLNALVNNNIFNSKDGGIEILNNLGLDANIRGEKLSLEDYAKLADEIQKNYLKN
ncbi:MAG: 16S rRNA (adenine(1518)-N(6)/adenine(1519)-N(6))-dimethyltransferase RsmA [Clostridia bacterium]|nr:16S rRNA (adenine(1518)-N(6)/adenine(1519)-N(6))-dimethyltransferase RsmA [Clostridia bacterium]